MKKPPYNIDHVKLVNFMKQFKLYHTNHESKNYFEYNGYGVFRIRHKDKVFLETKDSWEAVEKYNELESLFYKTYGTEEFNIIFKEV